MRGLAIIYRLETGLTKPVPLRYARHFQLLAVMTSSDDLATRVLGESRQGRSRSNRDSKKINKLIN